MTPGKLSKSALAALFAFIVLGTGCKPGSPPSPEKVTAQRLKWNLKTTVDAYDKTAAKDGRWNEPARKCLEEFAHSRAEKMPDGSWMDIISTNAATAISAGCADPMVNYLFIKFAMPQTNSKVAFADRFCAMAKDMNASAYPPVRKFYANARAMDQYYFTYGSNAWSRPEMHDFQQNMYQNAGDTMADKTVPSGEASDVSAAALRLVNSSSNNWELFYETMETQLMRNQSDNYLPWYLKGNHYVALGWMARGGGYADTITKEGGKAFEKDLPTAREAYEHAWKLDSQKPEIAVQMMTVVLGSNGDRKELDLWFNRAMNVDTNDYDACHSKLYFLEPKWYGSDEEQLAFGRECVQSTKWGGRVPLILVDAHWFINSRLQGEAQTNYWKQPEVWSDIQAAYERFFQQNPDEKGYYHNYALYAYRAEQWDKLNELIPKLGEINYDFFGGKDNYDNMIRLAKQHSSLK